MYIGVSAVKVRSSLNGFGYRGGGIRAVIMPARHIEIGYGPAVRYYEAFVAPFSAKDVIDKVVVGAAWDSAEAVVGYHHFLYSGLHHKVLESREVGFPKVPFAYFGIEGVPVPLRPGMHGEMLCAGVGLEYRGVGRPLKASHYGHAKLSGKIWVFSICLHSPSPPGIPENIDVGSPEGNAFVPTYMTFFYGHTVLDAGFVAYCAEDAVQEGLVKRGRHADWHGEHCCLSVSGNTVKGLVPPVVRRNPKGIYSLGVVHHERCLFLNGHFGNELFGPFLGGRCPAGYCRQKCNKKG